MFKRSHRLRPDLQRFSDGLLHELMGRSHIDGVTFVERTGGAYFTRGDGSTLATSLQCALGIAAELGSR